MRFPPEQALKHCFELKRKRRKLEYLIPLNPPFSKGEATQQEIKSFL